tara:strand:+ start:2931 stop:3419 length:489 start_codon:yes stop_codon:yes gene_type:complete
MNQSPKIKIQPGREGDANDIHHLLEELAESIDMKNKIRSVPANIVQYGFSSNPLFRTLLAKHEGNIIGLCLYFFTYSSWMGVPGIYIQDLFVKKKYRKQNVGKNLIIETIKINQSKDIKHVILKVDETNIQAKKFYEGLGFEFKPEEHTYFMKTENISAMGE